MKIVIISPGKAHDETVREGIAEYQKRLSASKKFQLEWLHPPAGTKESEGSAIKKLLKSDDLVVLLDERGKDIDTQQFAALLDSTLQSGVKRMAFIIGGAFGVDESVASMASKTFRVSSLVFPHMLVRLILTEQLYRASSILEGSKYHHA